MTHFRQIAGSPTIVSRPSQGLCTIPAWEGIRGETRMDQRKVGLVEDVVEVVVIIVHLRRRQLSLIYNIF